MMFLRHATLSIAGLLGAFYVWGGALPSAPTAIVLYSPRDTDVAPVVMSLHRAGAYVTDSPGTARLRLLRGPDAVVITRSALALQRDDAVGRAYADGALIVGLDMSLAEIEALVFGSPSRPSPPRVDGDPRLSMLYEETLAGGCGGQGSFSDWLSNWQPAAAFILHRAHEVSLFAEVCRD